MNKSIMRNHIRSIVKWKYDFINNINRSTNTYIKTSTYTATNLHTNFIFNTFDTFIETDSISQTKFIYKLYFN